MFKQEALITEVFFKKVLYQPNLKKQKDLKFFN